ncbi:hypothetical protein MMC13_005693 [Lambiella insularis]|nr:hypothetical protein [Lambiella insularis]
MINPDYALTFGVELELILVFHESLLIAQLRIDNGLPPLARTGKFIEGDRLRNWQGCLRKELSDANRKTLRQGAPHYGLTNPHYLGWGLTKLKRDRTSRPLDDVTDNRSEGARCCDNEDGEWVRTYDEEPLYIAKEALESGGTQDYWLVDGHFRDRDPRSRRFDIHDGELSSKPVTQFRNWHLTNDFSLSGLKRKELHNYLRQYKVSRYRDGSPETLFSIGMRNKTLSSTLATPGAPIMNEPNSSIERDIDEMIDEARGRKTTARSLARPDLFNTLEQNLESRRQPSAAELHHGNDSHMNSVSKSRKRKREWVYRGQIEEGFPNVNEWDTHGIELVSSVLEPTPTDFQTITDICDLIKGHPGQHHGATTNDTCGLHVHLKPKRGDFDLPSLKHLAYIIVMYEQQIDTLQPFHRRTFMPMHGSGGTYDFCSNYSNFINPITSADRSLADIRGMISAVEDVEALDTLMGPGKRFVVNFGNLRRADPESQHGPRTLEFRQHEGALRGVMVAAWVQFCAALLRLANHAATQLVDLELNTVDDFEAQCQIYPFEEWNDDMNVWDLFDLMGVGCADDLRTYFQRRSAYFALDNDLYRPASNPISSVPPASARPSGLVATEPGHQDLEKTSPKQDRAKFVPPGPASHPPSGASGLGPSTNILPNASQPEPRDPDTSAVVPHTVSPVQREAKDVVRPSVTSALTQPAAPAQQQASGRSAQEDEADDLPDYVSPSPPIRRSTAPQRPTVSPLTPPHQPTLPVPAVAPTSRGGLPGLSPIMSGWRDTNRQSSSESPGS